MATGDEPRQIGRYEIRRELGRGTMGVVYEASDPVLGRTIALKTVRALEPSSAEREAWEQRFLNEARAAARLSHPAIVVVHDVGRDPESGLLYMALEHLKGETLAQRLSSGEPLPWREALRVTGRVADALHHAHSQGVVHRDVKPANIVLLPSGEPKILDFGIARLDTGQLTMPGDLFGTPLYMSPEQAAGGTLDARSDLFSLGAITWAMLTGRTPFDGPSVGAILARVAHRHPKPPSELVPGIPPEIDYVVSRAMAKSADDRYPDGRSLCEDVEDVLAGREPRHRSGWTAPGERTVASSPGLRPEDLPDLDLPDEPQAVPPRRARARGRRFVVRAALLCGLLAAAAVYFVLHPEDEAVLAGLVRHWPGARALIGPIADSFSPAADPTVAPPQRVVPGGSAASMASVRASASPANTVSPSDGSPSSPVPAPAAEAVLSTAASAVVPPGGTAAAQPAKPGADSPDPAKPAQPGQASAAAPAGPIGREATAPPNPAVAKSGTEQRPLSTQSAQPTPRHKARSGRHPPAKKPAATAFLSIGFEHRLKSGSLQVWVDGREVAKETLDSHVTKKLLLFELRKGSIQQTLSLQPGRHRVRVRIRSGGEAKTADAAATFRAGTTRRLEVKVSRLSGKVSLDWE